MHKGLTWYMIPREAVFIYYSISKYHMKHCTVILPYGNVTARPPRGLDRNRKKHPIVKTNVFHITLMLGFSRKMRTDSYFSCLKSDHFLLRKPMIYTNVEKLVHLVKDRLRCVFLLYRRCE